MEGKALTVGVIADKLGCPIHRVEYLIRSRGIQPVQRAGNFRVFSQEALSLLQKEQDKVRSRTA